MKNEDFILHEWYEELSSIQPKGNYTLLSKEKIRWVVQCLSEEAENKSSIHVDKLRLTENMFRHERRDCMKCISVMGIMEVIVAQEHF